MQFHANMLNFIYMYSFAIIHGKQKATSRRTSQSWATLRKFNKDPMSWWNKFWLRLYPSCRDAENLVVSCLIFPRSRPPHCTSA